MQTNNREKELDARRSNVRTLKIQPKFRQNRRSQNITPEIKLSGNWLDKLGFHPEKRVVVTTMKELLIIRLEAV